ncbi:hypothetical protein Hanom_Chr07g00652771 [Helianthus anomalus]
MVVGCLLQSFFLVRLAMADWDLACFVLLFRELIKKLKQWKPYTDLILSVRFLPLRLRGSIGLHS